MIRKTISEVVGTMLLVFFGCGAAAVADKYFVNLGLTVYLPYSWLLVALAFGLAVTMVIYIFGRISGAHVNPAVSLGALINGRITPMEFICYVVAQVLGGIAGAGILGLILGSTTSLGANGYETLSILGAEITVWKAFAIEAILTFAFVLTVLSVTKKENCNSGVVIGIALTIVHIIGIPFTGTSVNPARSIGPALFVGGVAWEQAWLFIIAPLVGGAVAGLLYKLLLDDEEDELPYAEEIEDEYLDDEEDEEDEEEIEEVVVEEKPKRKTTTKKATEEKETSKKTTKK